jgi:hypothetical protein
MMERYYQSISMAIGGSIVKMRWLKLESEFSNRVCCLVNEQKLEERSKLEPVRTGHGESRCIQNALTRTTQQAPHGHQWSLPHILYIQDDSSTVTIGPAV